MIAFINPSSQGVIKTPKIITIDPIQFSIETKVMFPGF